MRIQIDNRIRHCLKKKSLIQCLVFWSQGSTTCVDDERVDERLVFTDMFPPLCHRARIALQRRKTTKSEEIAAYMLNFKNISNSGEYGKFWNL